MSLTFYYHMYGSAIGTLKTQWVPDSGSVIDLDSISGQQHTSNSATWTLRTVSLTAASGSGKIRFHYTSGNTYTGDAAIDDVNINGKYTWNINNWVRTGQTMWTQKSSGGTGSYGTGPNGGSPNHSGDYWYAETSYPYYPSKISELTMSTSVTLSSYNLNYNGNGGTVTDGTGTFTGGIFTLSDATLSGKILLEWRHGSTSGTSVGSSGDSFNPGSYNYNDGATVTLYAIWRDSYTLTYDTNNNDSVAYPETHSESDNPVTLTYVYPKTINMVGFSSNTGYDGQYTYNASKNGWAKSSGWTHVRLGRILTSDQESTFNAYANHSPALNTMNGIMGRWYVWGGSSSHTVYWDPEIRLQQ